MRKAVLFLGIKTSDGKFFPKATAFLVMAGEGDLLPSYLVTADHVVVNLKRKLASAELSGKGELAVRFNLD